MIYGTVYGNELTPLAPWLMGQRHYFYFHGTVLFRPIVHDFGKNLLRDGR